MKKFFLTGMLLSALTAMASQQTLATLTDPTGDDLGDGTLTYPQSPNFEPGDLDLTQLQVSRDEEGFWFEAQFKNLIRDPQKVLHGVGGESLANFARHGFFEFNIDLYIDMDRVKGSGNLFTLPGRGGARIDPAYAWERAVILTPQPELIRQQLIDVMNEQFPDRPKGDAESSIDASMFFPTKVRVHGKSIAFFAPSTFFNGSDGTDWGLTAFVTGAKSNFSASMSFFPSGKKPLDSLELGVLQPAPGHPKDTFGYVSPTRTSPSPIVDILGSTIEQQHFQLKDKGVISGMSWGMHASKDLLVVPAEPVRKSEVPPPVDSKESLLASPIKKIKELFGADTESKIPPLVPSNSKSSEVVVPVGQFLEQSGNDANRNTKPPPVTEPQSQIPAKPTIAARLETLKQLYDSKVISEPEYKQQRSRILNEL
jgi:hypothetical protein